MKIFFYTKKKIILFFEFLFFLVFGVYMISLKEERSIITGCLVASYAIWTLFRQVANKNIIEFRDGGIKIKMNRTRTFELFIKAEDVLSMHFQNNHFIIVSDKRPAIIINMENVRFDEVNKFIDDCYLKNPAWERCSINSFSIVTNFPLINKIRCPSCKHFFHWCNLFIKKRNIDECPHCKRRLIKGHFL